MKPFPSLSKTLKASLISSSESVSRIFLAIICGRLEQSEKSVGVRHPPRYWLAVNSAAEARTHGEELCRNQA